MLVQALLVGLRLYLKMLPLLRGQRGFETPLPGKTKRMGWLLAVKHDKHIPKTGPYTGVGYYLMARWGDKYETFPPVVFLFC